MFSETWEEDDIESGTIYVLAINHPFVAKHRDLIHKIAVTGSKESPVRLVSNRIQRIS